MNLQTGILCAASAVCCLTGVMLCGCSEAIEPQESNTADIVIPVTDPPKIVTTAETTTTTPAPIDWSSNTEQKNEGVVIQNVPHFTQFTSYKTACETLATCALLQYYGINMDPDLFLDGFLPIADYPETDDDGELHAESPWEYFIGDPMRKDAFGCYNGAIVRALNKIKSGLGVALRNKTLDTLCKDYIDKGEPVVIWATMHMAPAKKTFTWIMPDGDDYTFISPEHALVLIGYDEKNYYFSDSLQSDAVCSYKKEAVETAYDALYKQALVIDQTVLPNLPDFWKMPAETAEEADEGKEEAT